MIQRLIEMFREPEGGNAVAHEERNVAAAALLIEAGLADGRFDEAERAVIRRLLVSRLEVPEAEVDGLLAEAESKAVESADVWSFARVIKDTWDERGRIDIIEMLWEVAYADGHVEDFEANLLRRVAGLLYVPDYQAGDARKRVIERLGISEDEDGGAVD